MPATDSGTDSLGRPKTHQFQLLTATEAARLLGIKPQTLANLHSKPPAYGAPPVFMRTSGGHRRYRRADLIAWLNSRPRPSDLRAAVPRHWQDKNDPQKIDFLGTDNPYAGMAPQMVLELLTVRVSLEHQAAAAALASAAAHPAPVTELPGDDPAPPAPDPDDADLAELDPLGDIDADIDWNALG